MGIQAYLSYITSYSFIMTLSNSTASIEELSNTSIQFPRNIASKDKITMQSIITPFRGNKQTELVGSSNLLTSEKFSDDPALSSGMADILGGKSSLIRSLNGDLKKSPLFDSDTNGQFSEELPMIVIHNEDHQSVIK